MNIKIKLSTKQTAKYIFVAIISANLVGAYFLNAFLEKYLSGTFTYTPDDKQILTTDIDVDKFDRIIDNIEKKKQENTLTDLKDIF